MLKLLLSGLILFPWIIQCNELTVTESCEDTMKECLGRVIKHKAENQSLSISCNESHYSISYDIGYSGDNYYSFEDATFYFTCGSECTSTGKIYETSGSFSRVHDFLNDTTRCEVIGCFEINGEPRNLSKFNMSSQCRLSKFAVIELELPEGCHGFSRSQQNYHFSHVKVSKCALPGNATLPTNSTCTTDKSPTTDMTPIVAFSAAVVAFLVLSLLLIAITCIAYQRVKKRPSRPIEYIETFDHFGDDSCQPDRNYELELGSQMSVYHSLYQHARLTDDDVDNSISHSKVSTYSSMSLDTDNGSFNHILNSPSCSESSTCTAYGSNILMDYVNPPSDSKETGTHFRNVEYKLDASYVRSEETGTNLDSAQENKMYSEGDSDSEHTISEVEVSSIKAQIYSQPTSAAYIQEMEAGELSKIKFEFGDGLNSQSKMPILEFDPNYLAAPSNSSMLDFPFSCEASVYGYVSSVHKYFNTSYVSGDANMYEDVVLDTSGACSSSFLPYICFDSNTRSTFRSALSLHINDHVIFASGYISSDKYNFSLNKIVNNIMPSEEIPIYSTNH